MKNYSKFKRLQNMVQDLKENGCKVLCFCYPKASGKCRRYGLALETATGEPYVVFNTGHVEIAIATLESWGLK